MAIACHPDDIDFGMSGTLMMLKKAGYEIHYMDVANGSLGTAEYTYEEIVRIRREEAMNAAKTIGAVVQELTEYAIPRLFSSDKEQPNV